MVRGEEYRLGRIADNLRKRVKGLREYRIVSEGEPLSSLNRVDETGVYKSEYEDALRLKEQLVSRFQGKPLEEAIPGEVVSNDYSECYAISSECFRQLRVENYENSKRAILSNLKLLSGIGPVWEERLKRQGYQTIEDLTRHPRWGKTANDFLVLIEAKDVFSLQNWLRGRLPKSHPLGHYLASFCEEKDLAIVDIETLGLFGRPIILFGVARLDNDRICINQLLLRDIADEPGALWECLSRLKDSPLITFNGRSFDLPYIQERSAFYSVIAPLDVPHFDVLHFARRAFHDVLPNCRLETIEAYLGVKRKMDLPSAMVPEFYESYLQTRNVGPLVAIVEHNKQDLLTLTYLFSKLYEVWDT